MSDTTDLILDGAMCQVCGCWMDDVLDGKQCPGYPRTCEDCEADG